jgi:Sec7-like guanine-nucleotide exchange factor
MANRYFNIICDVPQLEAYLDKINQEKWEVISAFYTTDTNQVVLICNEKTTIPVLSDKEIREVLDAAS